MNNSNRRFKDAIYEQIARIGKAVANPKRLELLDLLCQCPRHVEALAKASDLSIANASQHLQTLRAAHLVAAEKKGAQVIYRITDASVTAFISNVRQLAEKHIAEIDAVMRSFFHGREAFTPVDRDELLRRVYLGEVIALDARPIEEFEAGHVPGAISVPLEQLEARMAELPRDREIVAYCRGPYCVLAIEAVERLRANGFIAFRLDLGAADLLARGLEIQTGKARP